MIQAFCTGQYQQYADVGACVNVLASKPENAFPMFFSDTIVCRANHLPMTTVDPALHCPHVGPTGGGACV
uniref:Uncharacterized protein n=1 Tax=Arcella intermedia TaxID=1963864 RepID=A0A6B2LX38_9EUKA